MMKKETLKFWSQLAGAAMVGAGAMLGGNSILNGGDADQALVDSGPPSPPARVVITVTPDADNHPHIYGSLGEEKQLSNSLRPGFYQSRYCTYPNCGAAQTITYYAD